MERDNNNKRRRLEAAEDPAAALRWLLGGACEPDAFWSQHWGKAPLHGARAGASEAARLFDKAALCKLAAEHELLYGLHLNVVSCPDGAAKQVVHEEGKRATVADLDGFLEEAKGCTIQLFQPQRHAAELRAHMAALEAQFGSLWGANVYATAGATQGLAPHYDDVDVFVLQTSGSKRWKVHGPSEPFQELALEYSEDLEEVGPLLLDVTLKPGDLLYLPRGTTHYAVAAPGEPSIHITLSTHQKHTYYNLLDKGMTRILDAAASTDVAFRRGLPVGYLQTNGTWHARRAAEPGPLCSTVAALLRSVADKLEAGRADEDESVTQALHEAVDEFAADFMANRLPPSAQPSGPRYSGPLKMSDAVRLVDPRLVHVQLSDSPPVLDSAAEAAEEEEEEREEEEDEEEEEEEAVRVLHCLNNAPEAHMGAQQPLTPAKVVKLPPKATSFVGALVERYPGTITIAEASDGNQEALAWADALGEAGLLSGP